MKRVIFGLMLVQLILLTKYQICENYGIETKLGIWLSGNFLNLGYIGKKNFGIIIKNEFLRLQ